MRQLNFSQLRRAEYAVVVTIVVFVAIIVVFSALAGSQDVVEHITKIDPAVLTGLCALSLVNYFTRACRWHYFSRKLHIEVPFHRTLLYYFAGFAMTTTPGKIGETLRLWLLEKCHRCDYGRGGPLFIADRLSDLNAMLALSIIGLAAFSNYLWVIGVSAVALVLLTLLFLRPGLLIGVINTCYLLIGKRGARLFGKARQALRLTARLFNRRVFVWSLILAITGWLAECYAFYWLLNHLGANVGFPAAIFIFAFSMIAGGLSMMPGGLGGVEVVMTGLLIGVGVDPAVAIAATTIIRITTLWFSVGLGFLALPMALRLARQGNVVLERIP